MTTTEAQLSLVVTHLVQVVQGLTADKRLWPIIIDNPDLEKSITDLNREARSLWIHGLAEADDLYKGLRNEN